MISRLQRLMIQTMANYHLLELKKDQWKDSRQLRNSQFKKLRAILSHAYNYVPYYHRLFSSSKIKPEDIKNQSDLRKIPLTSKQDIQKNPLDIVPKGIDVSRFPRDLTTGSTGIPLDVIYDYSSLGYRSAARRYPFYECGVKPSDRFVLISARKKVSSVRRYAKLWGEICEIAVPMLPHERLANLLSSINPDVIWSCPSVLTPLVSYDTSEIRPRSIFALGEVVTADCRDLLEKTFDTKLFETYGSVEFGHLAFECRENCGLHMIIDDAYFEFLDENKECISEGEDGEIVITGLHNRIMPLIRYRIGDIGVPSNDSCPCGRSWPLMRSIQGRINDFIVLPNGKKLNLPHFYHCIYEELNKKIFSISQYQIVQDRKERISFKVVKGKEFDLKVLERIKDNLEAYFASQGGKLEVVMQVVEEIPQERTGKRRIVISRLN